MVDGAERGGYGESGEQSDSAQADIQRGERGYCGVEDSLAWRRRPVHERFGRICDYSGVDQGREGIVHRARRIVYLRRPVVETSLDPAGKKCLRHEVAGSLLLRRTKR